jgi:hypothetical protein
MAPEISSVVVDAVTKGNLPLSKHIVLVYLKAWSSQYKHVIMFSYRGVLISSKGSGYDWREVDTRNSYWAIQ